MKASTSSAQENTSLLPEVIVKSDGATEISAKPKSIIVSVCSFILITEFCERLAYYGLSGSLPIFFRKHFGMSNVLATELNSAFSSMVYVTPLLGAYMADKHWGRYATILVFCAWYLAGLVICVIASHPKILSPALFMTGLFAGVAFGTGGIKPNVVVLGADQFDITIPKQRAEKDSFFNWFYWAINIGATFSFGFIANVAVSGLPPLISKEYGFFFSFLIPAFAFLVAFIVFIMGSPRYKKVPPRGSALSIFMGIILEAGRASRKGFLVLTGGGILLPAIAVTITSFFIVNDFWHMVFALSGAVLVLCGTAMLIVFGQSTEWLDAARRCNGGSHSDQDVKDAKQVLRLSPYLSFVIMFWAVYGQQSTNFLIQGCQMDLRVGDVQLSSAMLSILDSSVILVFIPIFDKCLYPCLEKMGVKLTLLRKIGAGFFFCVLAMIVAGILEIYRKKSPEIPNISSNCGRTGEYLPMSTMVIWWQAAQYMLIGIGEILTSISSYDLFYSEVPESMRSVCQAFNLLTTTLGCIVAAAMNSIFSFWIPSNLNDGQLQYIFFILALMMLFNLIGFVIVSQSFEYHYGVAHEHVVSGYSPAVTRLSRIIGKFKPSKPIIGGK